jgi:hypothetical protein
VAGGSCRFAACWCCCRLWVSSSRPTTSNGISSFRRRRNISATGISAAIFLVIALFVVLAVAIFFVWPLWRNRAGACPSSFSASVVTATERQRRVARRRVASGLAVTAIAWILSWGKHPDLGPVRLYLFTPLWVGYILVVNGWKYG